MKVVGQCFERRGGEVHDGSEGNVRFVYFWKSVETGGKSIPAKMAQVKVFYVFNYFCFCFVFNYILNINLLSNISVHQSRSHCTLFCAMLLRVLLSFRYT